MQGNHVSVLALAPAIVSALLAIGVMTVFAACGLKEDGTWMHCHDVQLLIAACGAVMTVVTAAAAFVKSAGAKIALYIVAAIGCIVVLVAPGVMPLCMMDTMRCHAVMVPFARIMAVVVCALVVVNVVRAVKGGEKRPRYGRL